MEGVAAGIRNRPASERSRDGGCRARARSHVRSSRTLWNSHRALRAQMLTEFYTPSLCTPERAPVDAARSRVATPESPERAFSSMLPFEATTETGSINCHMSRSSPHAPRRCCPLRQQPSPAPTSCARHPARHALVDAALSSVQAGGNNRVAFLSFDALSPAAAPHRRARSEASPSLRVRSGEPTEGRARTSRA